VSQKRKTLVFEPIGTFFEVIDPSKGEFYFGDPSLQQVSVEIGGRLYITIVRIWTNSLSSYLRKFSKRYEVVIYTILPREIMSKILMMIPEASTYITKYLCSGELLDNMFDAPVVCKDLDLLAANRKYKLDGNKL
jgi:hypothetical protein